jgi:hypothetical protein
MNAHRHSRRASVLQVLAVLASICLLGVGLVGLAVYRTITVGADLRAVRNVVLKDLHVHCASRIEVTAHPLLVDAARFGLSFAPLEREARLAIQSFRGAEVGVYELTSRLDQQQRHALFQKVDRRMEAQGWSRTVAVLNHDDLVLVYSPDRTAAPDRLEAFVVVLNDDNLVLVSGKGNLEPIAELIREKMGDHLPGPLFAQLLH